MRLLRTTLVAIGSLACTGPLAAQIEVYRLEGDWPGFFGTALANAGDVDGDGFLDWILAGDPDPALPGEQLVYVHSGLDGSRLLTLRGDAYSEQFGGAVAGLGDVDGDGRGDVAVADRFSDHHGDHSGRVWVFSGREGALLYALDGVAANDGFGSALDCAGDVDADGVRDVIVGASNGNGCVRVFSGRDGSLLHELFGAAPWDDFGDTVTGLGDVDHDGHDDFAVGARFEDIVGFSSGSVRVFSGADASLLHYLPGWEPFLEFGAALDSAGDVDRDGTPDLIVGTPAADTTAGADAGAAWVYSGADGSLLVEFLGHEPYGYFGWRVVGPGDIDGDGIDDLAVAARFEYDAGRVWLYSGRGGKAITELHGERGEQAYGLHIAAAGDLNLDRLGDLLVCSSDTAHGLGLVRVLTSFDLAPPVSYCTAKVNSVGCLPRVDFEGSPTVMIGARPLTVTAADVVNESYGTLLWGLGSAHQPFGGGTLCVDAAARSAPLATGGSLVGVDCTGVLAFAFSETYLALHGLGPGDTLYAQFVYRDPTHPDGTGLGSTDALSFTIGL